jgi:hypothetical protein
MLETLDNYLVKRYVADLKRELQIQGLNEKRLTEVLTEAQAHIEDAMEAAQPQSVEEIERVLAQFGDAKSMAKSLTSEYARQSSARPYIWPAAFFVVALFLFRNFPWNFSLFRHGPHSLGPNGLHIFGKTFFPAGIWGGSLFLLASAITLVVLGFRARRPALGQFIVAGIALILVSTGWYAATSYPAAYFQGYNHDEKWLYPIKRGEFDQTVAQMNARIDDFHHLAKDLRSGQQSFAAANSPGEIPAQFKFGSLYLSPEAIREHNLGIAYQEMWPGIMTSSWKDATIAWSNRPQPGRPESEASEIFSRIPAEVTLLHKQIAYLQWVHIQPLSVLIWDDYRMGVQDILPVTLMAAVTSAIGWVAWITVLAIGRAVRRNRYRGDVPQQA